VIQEIVSGRDGLVVMPTGGGKSLCFQMPALCFGGVTLVVSPLIALMKDQVDALVARGIEATVINSTLSWPEQKERLDGMRRGRYKLVYVAPERFRAESFLNALAGWKSRCSRWTKPTASASGATISGRTTCASARR
jgi:ATP-dependent DNA helicase RecQ